MIPDNISEAGVRLVKKFEGLHKEGKDGLIHSYRCPAGKYTIGWGSCKGVRSGMRITVEEAEARLVADLEDHAKAIHRYVEVPLSQNQYDALTSFIFNVGAANFKSSTLLSRLNSGQYHDVPNQLMRWNKARVDGKLTPLRGLTRRRAAEAALFSMDAKLAGDGGDKMPQKIEEAKPKPLTQSKTMAGAGVAGAATALSEIAPQIEALVPYSDSMKTIFLLCAVGGIALVAYSRWKDSKEGTR